MRYIAGINSGTQRLSVFRGYYGITTRSDPPVADWGAYDNRYWKQAERLAAAMTVGGRVAERALRREHEAVARARRQ